MSRTVIEFMPAMDPWPTIEAWAAANKFTLASHGPWGRTYKRGDGFFTPISHVQFEGTPVGLRLSAWVPAFGFAGEFGIHDVDMFQYFPRKKAQKLVNALLRQLGAPTLGG